MLFRVALFRASRKALRQQEISEKDAKLVRQAILKSRRILPDGTPIDLIEEVRKDVEGNLGLVVGDWRDWLDWLLEHLPQIVELIMTLLLLFAEEEE